MPNDVSGYDLGAQVAELELRHPDLYACIDPARVTEHIENSDAASARLDDFGLSAEGGRGQQYVRAQRSDVTARSTGISRLIQLARENSFRSSPERLLVDLLGGDGLVHRVCGLLRVSDFRILTCDASPYMVSAAWSMRIPAVLQRAEQPLMRASSVDAVLLAYGSHHIPPAQRQIVASEAYRMLRPGGVFILHDFLVGSPMDKWFSEVVHKYSSTGHDYRHFTENEMVGYLAKGGFEKYGVQEMDDPYVIAGPTAEESELRLGRYLVDMYGLSRATTLMGAQNACYWAVEQATKLLRDLGPESSRQRSIAAYDSRNREWRSMIPRTALVGIGQKLA